MILDGKKFRNEIENNTPSKIKARVIVDDIEQIIIKNKLEGRCTYTISNEDMRKYGDEIKEELNFRFTYLHSGFEFRYLSNILPFELCLLIIW